MLLSAAPTNESQSIQQYIRIVISDASIGASIFKDLFAGIGDIVSGKGICKRVIEEALMNALRELTGKAAQMGTNAFAGINLNFETVGSGGSISMVVAAGTAVKI